MKNRTHRTLLALVSILALLITACAEGDDGTAAPAEDTGADTTAQDDTGDEPAEEPDEDAAAGDAEGGFDPDLVAAAQEEGEVALYAGGHTREGVEMLAQTFQEDFGITVNFIREDSGSVVQMVEAELAGGELNADVVSLTDAPSLLRWSAEGTIRDVDVPNGDDIIEALQVEEPFVPYSVVPLGIMYNEAVTDDVPARWADLTADDFDDVIVMANPSASGTALMWFHMMTELMGDEYWEELAQQNVIVTDSALALAQMTITGEADFGIPAIESAVASAAEGGEPLAAVFPEEGVPTFTSAVAVLDQAARPNAAELLVQYHISEQFQNNLVDLGARTVLEDGPQPEGAPDFGDANLLTPDFQQLDAEAEQLRARFDELFR